MVIRQASPLAVVFTCMGSEVMETRSMAYRSTIARVTVAILRHTFVVSPQWASAMRRRTARKGTSGFGETQLGKMALTWALPLSLLLLALFSGSAAMQQLEDHELAEVTGQALMQMAKTLGQGVSQDVTFYKAGLDAVLEMNLNIDKLQLGCGGINGPGCDIDIDQFSLSGTSWVQGRPESSAVLTRPFFEFAIKNDDKPGLREVVGIRLSAEQAKGLLTFGENTPEPNGINTISGYMVTNPITGTAQTKATNLGCGMAASQCAGGIADATRTIMRFAANVNVTGCTSGCGVNRATTIPGQSKGVYIPSMSVPFSSTAGAVVYGNRQTYTTVQAVGKVPNISLNGSSLTAKLDSKVYIAGIINMQEATTNLSGTVTGLKTEINFQESLGYIHKIEVDSPFYLSFQSDRVFWPDSVAADVALPGWWMSFRDPVELGELNPVQQVDISPTFGGSGNMNDGINDWTVNGSMSQAFYQYFEGTPIPVSTGQGWDQLISGQMNVPLGTRNIPSTVTMDLQDLHIGHNANGTGAQDVPRNCWGTARFC